jgi:hypothetical protein
MLFSDICRRIIPNCGILYYRIDICYSLLLVMSFVIAGGRKDLGVSLPVTTTVCFRTVKTEVINPLYFGTGAAAGSSSCRRLSLMSAAVAGGGCTWKRVVLSPAEHTRHFRVTWKFTRNFNWTNPLIYWGEPISKFNLKNKGIHWFPKCIFCHVIHHCSWF